LKADLRDWRFTLTAIAITMCWMQKAKHTVGVKICMSILFAVLLTNFWVLAQAQGQNDGTGDKHSAHIKTDPEADTPKTLVEQKIVTKMQIPGIQFNSCEAFITLQYYQRNTFARVESSVENKSCTTSMGEYELLVNLVDENGVSRNLSFSETWEQKGDSQVKLSRDYPIGEDVTLKRVVAQRIRCECTEIDGSD
jgi:hypothetical protein